ncbi:hypothetical protein H5P28_12040 [Ruficoccus amylovorans]|uniref:Uncharacterized protein n=1 Tax=Ruficoccus amylovorans TaxID=1804625 RepID=A0A842HG28_9BACT|nr:hypothetical protein [Ruficoccus amylovorans]MBC2594988.1 hypothetical protein [Ruficoccus amylovorans]
MSDSDADFIRQHPEYFEAHGSYLVLRHDLSPLMEKYARAIDSEEFERLRQQVEAIHQQERTGLQQQLDDLRQQHQNATARQLQLQNNLHSLDRAIAQTHYAARLSSLSTLEDMTGKWYRSPTLCLTIDIFGLIMLYIGLIMGTTISLSSTVLGIACIGLGFTLYEQPASFRKIPSMNRFGTMSPLDRENMDKITRIKRITLVEELRNEQKRVRFLNSQIEAYENALHQLDA